MLLPDEALGSNQFNAIAEHRRGVTLKSHASTICGAEKFGFVPWPFHPPNTFLKFDRVINRAGGHERCLINFRSRETLA